MMTPDKDRKAKERKAKREAGLVPVEVWIYPELKGSLAKFVAELTDRQTIDRIMKADTPLAQKREALLAAGLTQGAAYAVICAHQAENAQETITP